MEGIEKCKWLEREFFYEMLKVSCCIYDCQFVLTLTAQQIV